MTQKPSYDELQQQIKLLQQQNAALKAENKDFKSLIEISGYSYEWVFWLNSRFQFEYISDSCQRISGYTPAEFKKNPKLFFSIVKESYRNQFEEKLQLSLKKPTAESLHFEIQTKHGQSRWVSMVIPPVESRKQGYLFGSIKDITKHLEAQQQLKNSKAQIKAILDNLPFMAWFKDCDGRFLAVNKVFAEACGVPRREIPGKTDFEIWDSALAEKYLKDDKDVIQEKKSLFVEEIIRVGDENLWFETYKTPIYNSENEVIGTTGMARDITERKQYEMRLKRKKGNLQHASKLAQIGYWTWDVKKKDVYWSAELYKIYGYPPTVKASSEKFYELIHPEDKSIVLQEVDATLNQTKSYDIEFRIIRSDNQVRHLKTIADISYDPNGNPLSLFGATQDITDWKQIQIELTAAKQKAEQADRLKSAFLANMSHEIRTPLNGIIGFAELMQQENCSPKKQEQYLDIILSSSRNLLNLINDIIDISKIDARQIKIVHEKVALNQLLSETYTFFQQVKRVNEKQNIKFELKTPREEHQSVIFTDSFRLTQILNNLLGNAFKFTHTGSIQFGYEIKNVRFLKFFVRDTGIGISREKFQSIFERFRQADDHTVRKYGGTGLGLTISKALIKMLGGEIWLESEIGKGSCFYFTLPYKKAPLEKLKKNLEPVSVTSSYQWEDKNILVVEDDDISFYFIEELLAKTRVKLLRAKDGLEAVEKVKTHPEIDLVLMDIELPGIMGYEATIRIKEMRPELPVIAQTAYAISHEKERCFSAGCDGYMAKPLDARKFLPLIGKFLGT